METDLLNAGKMLTGGHIVRDGRSQLAGAIVGEREGIESRPPFRNLEIGLSQHGSRRKCSKSIKLALNQFAPEPSHSAAVLGACPR